MKYTSLADQSIIEGAFIMSNQHENIVDFKNLINKSSNP